MTDTRLAALSALAALATSCRTSAPAAIDPAMAACVPATASILAGLNLAQLRDAPLYPTLPAAIRALIDPLHDAEYALLASDGINLAVISRGAFREPPPGAQMLAPGLAIAGAPALVRAATAQHRARAIAAPQLLTPAEPLASVNPVWIVLRGSATLPLSGNAANLNRLLRATEYTTVAGNIKDSIALQIAGVCRTPDAGRDFEQSVRAMLSLAAAGNARQPDLAALLLSIQVRLDGRIVRITVATNAKALNQLLRAF